MVGNEDAKKQAWSPLYHNSWCQSGDCRGKGDEFYSCLCPAAKRGPEQTQDQRAACAIVKRPQVRILKRKCEPFSMPEVSEQKVALRPVSGSSQELI